MNEETAAKLQSMHLPLDGVWMPEGTSTMAADVDFAYWVIYWVCIAVFIAMMGAMGWFMWRYRRKNEGQKAESQNDHNQLIEILWSVLPLLFFFWVFVIGFRGFLDLYIAPSNAMEVRVTGQKWFWSMQYPYKENERLVVGGPGAEFVFPVHKPVKIVLTGVDVLHSFYVPNFRIKMDAVPGRYTTLWFEATRTGEFPLLCTEYCGQDHSNMLGKIKIVEEPEYLAWLNSVKDKGDVVSADQGKALYASKGCLACHSVDGSKIIGPSFKGLYGRKESTDKGEVQVDDNYIRESILNPTAKVVSGYPPAMPPQNLSPKEIDSIILFLKTLQATP